MKKLIFSLALIASAVASADDSYIYWMVDSARTDYTHARIYAASGDTQNYLTIYDSGFDSAYTEKAGIEDGGGSVLQETVADFRANGEGFYAALGSNTAADTFIIELWNDSQFVGQSSLDASSLAQYVYHGGTSPAPVSMWAPQSFIIPEPSSGLLMLVGCAVLGLRRRRQKNA